MSLTFEKVLVLKNVPMFESVSEQALADLISAAEEKNYKPGEAIIAAGCETADLYIILSGRAVVERADTVLRELGPRSVFGEETVFAPRRACESVIVREATLLLKISADRLFQMMALHSSLGRRFLKELSVRVQTAR